MPGLPHSHFPVAAALTVAMLGAPRPGAAAGRLSHSGSEKVSDRQAIGAVLDRSAAAWTRGDLDGFMACYEDAPDTSYVRPDGPVRGAAAVRAMYAARFRPGGRGMGRLSTELLDVRHLGVDYALVTGRYHLARTAAEGGEAHGVFTLVFRRDPSGWRIISDHTS